MNPDLVGKRQEIADALSTVTGITGKPYKPSTPKRGFAWPELQSIEREEGWWVVTWLVVVYLPQVSTIESSERWIEENLDALLDGITTAGYVAGIESANIGSPQEPEFALTLQIRSE